MKNYVLIITATPYDDRIGQLCSKGYSFIMEEYDVVAKLSIQRNKNWAPQGYKFEPRKLNSKTCKLLNSDLTSRLLYYAE